MRCYGKEYTKEQIRIKREKLLLLSHGLATGVNIGKVVINKQITSLNYPMVLRTMRLVFNALKREFLKIGATARKAELAVLKNRLEIMETVVLAERCIIESEEEMQKLQTAQEAFEEKNRKRTKRLNASKTQLALDLEELKKLNTGAEENE